VRLAILHNKDRLTDFLDRRTYNGKESHRNAVIAAKDCEQKKMSNSELARRMGVSRSTVSRLISGRMTLTVLHLYLFADALGVSPKDLLVEENRADTRA